MTEKDWRVLVETMNISGIPGEITRHCTLKSFKGNQVMLHLESCHNALISHAAIEHLRESISEDLLHPVSLVIDLHTLH